MLIYFLNFCLCFLLSLLVVKFSHHFIVARDMSIDAVQSAHSTPTPRLGGMIFISTFVILGIQFKIVPFNLVFGLLPLILMGLMEDISIEILPRYRLLIAAIAAFFCVVYLL